MTGTKFNPEKMKQAADAAVGQVNAAVTSVYERMFSNCYTLGYDQAMKDFRVGPYVHKNEVNKI